MKKVIGIDGGGTKTEFVLCDEAGSVLKRIVLTSSNPVDIGMDNSCNIIKSGITGLLNGDIKVDGMFAGISGGSVSNNKYIIASYIKEAFPDIKFNNGTDAINVISTELKNDDGVVLIAGTGCCAFAKRGNELLRIGGWGYLFDGAGGGYDIGNAAVRAVLNSYDDIGPETVLTELFKTQMNIDVPKEISKIYEGGKSYIASFAPLVFKGYEMSDNVSKNILEKTVDHWAIIIKKAMEKVPHSKKAALAGSIFKQNDIVLPMLRERMSCDCDIIVSHLPPVYGAVREALKIAGCTASEDTEFNFLKTYGEKQ